MHLLVLLQQPLPSRKAMTITTFRDVAAHARLGHRVTIAAPLTADEATVRDWYGLPDEVAFAPVGDGSTSARRVQLNLARQARRPDVDLVQTRILATALARPRNAALVYERHEFRSGKARALVERRLVGRPRTILLANSPTTLSRHQAAGIGTGVDGTSALISAPVARDGLLDLPGAPLRVHIIRPNATHTDMLQALMALPGVVLHVVGETGRPGGLSAPSIFARKRPMSAGLLDDLSRNPDVVEHGFIEPLNLVETLATTHVGLSIYPHGAGRTPVKAMDALAAGCALIASERPAAHVAMCGDAGILVPARDADAVVAAVVELRDDPARLQAMRLEALDRARALSAERRVKQTLDALASKVGRRIEA